VYAGRCMNRRIPILVFAAALLAPALPPPLARAADWPDSAQRAALQNRIGRLGRVQILGSRGATLLLKPVVRDDGLHMREPYRPPRQALIEIGDVPPPPPPVPFVPWSEIRAVQVPASGFASGAGMGAALGAIMAGTTLLAFRHEISRNWENYEGVILVGVPLFVGAGALAGGLVFGVFSGGWRTVYPVAPPRR